MLRSRKKLLAMLVSFFAMISIASAVPPGGYGSCDGANSCHHTADINWCYDGLFDWFNADC